MVLAQMFESNEHALETGMRRCGTCKEVKPVSEFYKDGKDGHGNTRWRRDCKDCYKVTRMHDEKLKKLKNI